MVLSTGNYNQNSGGAFAGDVAQIVLRSPSAQAVRNTPAHCTVLLTSGDTVSLEAVHNDASRSEIRTVGMVHVIPKGFASLRVIHTSNPEQALYVGIVLPSHWETSTIIGRKLEKRLGDTVVATTTTNALSYTLLTPEDAALYSTTPHGPSLLIPVGTETLMQTYKPYCTIFLPADSSLPHHTQAVDFPAGPVHLFAFTDYK